MGQGNEPRGSGVQIVDQGYRPWVRGTDRGSGLLTVGQLYGWWIRGTGCGSGYSQWVRVQPVGQGYGPWVRGTDRGPRFVDMKLGTLSLSDYKVRGN